MQPAPRSQANQLAHRRKQTRQGRTCGRDSNLSHSWLSRGSAVLVCCEAHLATGGKRNAACPLLCKRISLQADKAGAHVWEGEWSEPELARERFGRPGLLRGAPPHRAPPTPLNGVRKGTSASGGSSCTGGCSTAVLPACSETSEL